MCHKAVLGWRANGRVIEFRTAFINSFIQSSNMYWRLLYSKHCVNLWGFWKSRHASCPHTVHSTQGRQALYNKHTQKYNYKQEVQWKLLQERHRGDISVIMGSGQDCWQWSWDLEITDDRSCQRRHQGRREWGLGNYISGKKFTS